jgi:pilus assembly protein FimV
MGLRTKAYFSGMFLTFFSSMAAALGLGEIKLNSALNQPLDAEIQLLHVRGLTENEVIVGIATPDEFTRAGVERNFFVTDLDFDLDLSAAQGPIVRITSSEPVREPFLNFVVSARWPSGKLLREYTLLVDLPVFSGAQSAPVQAANQTRSQPAPSSPTTSSSAPRVSSSQPREDSPGSVSSYASDTYGPVGANETLWSIASKIKPDSSVSVQQTMLAIQRMNPDAFINGNINLLRRGQVLRVPDKEEIQQLSSRDAIQQVAAQNRSWTERSSDRAQLEGSKSFSQTRSEPSTVEGRVKLSSPSDAKIGQGTGSEEGENGEVSEALNQAQEELDAADRENADLKSRIQSMEEQIQTMERLVEVSSEEMRSLELAAQQANQQSEMTAEADPAAESEIAETETSPNSQVETSAEPAPATDAAPVVEQEPAQPPIKAPPPQKSWLDLAMDNILYIGVGLGVLVLALVVYLLKRRREESYEEYDEYDADGDADLSLTGDGEFEEDKTLPLHSYDDVEEFVQEEHALAEAETEDVVGECDIHVAYGQYDQAEEKLLRALEKDPGNIPVRLKLLEVFSLQGDADSFDQHYARLRMTGDSDAIDRASMMRSSIDGIEPFDETLYETSGVAATADGDHHFDASPENSFDTADDTLDFDFNDVDELVDSSSAAADSDDFSTDSLDFDLTQDDEDITRIPAAVSAAPDSNDELAELDFDLGDLDEGVSGQRATDVPTSLHEDSDMLGDIDFDMPESELGISDDDKVADDLTADFDLEFSEEERFTSEFTGDLVAERTAPKDEEAFDFADLDLTDSTQDADDSLVEQTGDMDFDLDDDLARAQSFADEPPVLSSAATDSEADLDSLGFNDLESLDLDNEPDSLSPSDSTVASNRPAVDSASDFDVDFDLDKDINLDELDHELDALASNFDSTSAGMEEPLLDFDDELESGELESGELESFAASDNDSGSDEALVDLDFEEEKDTSSVSSATSAEKNSNQDFEIPDFDPENDDDSNLDFLSDNDETATKLDLARAYIDMGDSDGAKDILDEIMDEGNDQQKREAEVLLSRIG